MPWKRINGHRYFYLARREQGRVVQQYVGAGPDAEAVAAAIEMRRQERALEREQRKNEQNPYPGVGLGCQRGV